MQRLLKTGALLLLNTLFLSSLYAQNPAAMTDSMALAQVWHHCDSLLNSDRFVELTAYQKKDSTTISSVVFFKKPDRIRVYADKQLAYAPFREASVDSLLAEIGSDLREPFDKYRIKLFAGKANIRTLVPNYYRSSSKTVDRRRSSGQFKRKSPPLVQNLSKPYLSASALYNTNIALWHSHCF